MNIKLSETDQAALGERLCLWIDGGIDQKGSAPSDWWNVVERQYRNEAPPQSANPSFQIFQVNFTQPRVDALVANMMSALFRQDPLMLVSDVPEPIKTPAQHLVHKALTQAGVESACRKAALHGALLNRGILRVAPQGADEALPFSGGQIGGSAYGRVVIGSIHPKDFVIYPATAAGIPASRLQAHRFTRTYDEVKHLQEVGVYYKNAQTAPGVTFDDDVTGAIEQTQTDPDSVNDTGFANCEIWNGIAFIELRDGEKPQKVHFSVDRGARSLLQLQPYELDYSWYVTGSCVDDDTLFWSGMSVGRNLQPLQNIINNLHSAIYTGALMTAMPPIYGPELDEKDKRYGYGEYIVTDGPVQPWQGSGTFQAQPIIAQINAIEMLGDKVARVSANTMGSVSPGAQTATENSIIAQGVAVGIEEYISTFSAEFPSLVMVILQILAKWFGDELPPEELELIDAALQGTWVPSGQSPGNTPMAKLQYLQMLATMSVNPAFGFDPYQVATLIANNGPVDSASTGIQIPREMYDMQMQAAMMPEGAVNEQSNSEQAGGGEVPGDDPGQALLLAELLAGVDAGNMGG